MVLSTVEDIPRPRRKWRKLNMALGRIARIAMDWR